MVEREQRARAEALDLERPPELPAQRVHDAVRRDDQERQVGEGDRRDRQAEHDGQLAPPAPSPGDHPEQRNEDGRVELDRDPDPDYERPGTETAAQDEQEGSRDERCRDEVEARQDHAAEQQRDERDHAERNPAIGLGAPEPVKGRGEEEHADRAGDGHLGREHDAVRAERVA